MFGGALRGLFGEHRQVHCQLVLAATLKHADHPPPRARPRTFAVDGQCVGEVRHALAVLGDLEQQLGAALVQPGVVQGKAIDLLDDGRHCFTGLEVLLVLVQEQTGIDVFATAQAAGFSAKLHLFVGKDAEVGQHELRPVLVKVAEKHQAQSVAQVHDGQAEQAILQWRAPLAERLGVGELFAQDRQPVALPAFWLFDGMGETLDDFRLQQHLEQGGERHRRLPVDPAQSQQWLGGDGNVADLEVIQFALPEVRPLAHHHPHQ
ncbi:hypothetical protein D3C73_845300 [compost metagenome]